MQPLKTKFFLISALVITAFFTAGCSRPHQIHSGNPERNISFWGFSGDSELAEVQSRISKWDIDYVLDEKSSYATITAEWISFENVNYSQIIFYFNSNKTLYKIL